MEHLLHSKLCMDCAASTARQLSFGMTLLSMVGHALWIRSEHTNVGLDAAWPTSRSCKGPLRQV